MCLEISVDATDRLYYHPVMECNITYQKLLKVAGYIVVDGSDDGGC